MLIEEIKIMYNIKSTNNSYWLPDMVVSAVIDGEMYKVFLSKIEKNISHWKVICGFDLNGREIDKERLEVHLLNHPQLRIHLLLA